MEDAVSKNARSRVEWVDVVEFVEEEGWKDEVLERSCRVAKFLRIVDWIVGEIIARLPSALNLLSPVGTIDLAATG